MFYVNVKYLEIIVRCLSKPEVSSRSALISSEKGGALVTGESKFVNTDSFSTENVSFITCYNSSTLLVYRAKCFSTITPC